MAFKFHWGWLLLATVLFLGVLAFAYYFYNKSDDNGGNNKNMLDDSDCPVPPTTLQFNSTYQAPKRNCNITVGGTASEKVMHEDPVNGKYVFPSDEIGYTL